MRWSTGLRALLLTGATAALAAGHLGAGVVLAVLTVAAGTPAYPAVGPVSLFVSLGVLLAGTAVVAGRRGSGRQGREAPVNDESTAGPARRGGAGGAGTALDP